MAKAIALTQAALSVPQITPKAATPARAQAAAAVSAPEVKADLVPLQVRLPREVVRSIKIAAAEREQTISEFMQACFHASMKSSKSS